MSSLQFPLQAYPPNLIEAIFELSRLHAEKGIIWDLASGERMSSQYCGIAYYSGSGRWRDVSNWCFSNDLETVLVTMLEMIETESVE